MKIPLIGIILVATGAIGAGMFSLPIISTGLWFIGSATVMVLVWAANLAATLMYVDANLRFPAGASFHRVVNQSLNKTWGLLSNIGIAFVLYILLYAFFSASGSVINKLFGEALSQFLSVSLGQGALSLGFGLMIAIFVWAGTRLVGHVCTILFIGMGVTFALASSGLLAELKLNQLMTMRNVDFTYAFAALPYLVTALACAALVPTVVNYYNKDRGQIRNSFIWGTLVALGIYLLWNAAVLGVLDRAAMLNVISLGGNMGELVTSLQAAVGAVDEQQFDAILAVFSCFAIATSFLSIGVSLVDFLSDRFSFSDKPDGRAKAVIISFAPPAILSFIFPNGFVLAIGYAGLAVLFSFYIIPAAIALKYADSERRNDMGAISRLLTHRSSIVVLLAFTVVAIIAKLLTLAGAISVYP